MKLKDLDNLLEEYTYKHKIFVFNVQDIGILLNEDGATLRKTLERAVQDKILVRACRNVYVYEKSKWFSHAKALFETAAVLRRGEMNYVSLDYALSDYGVISQMSQVLTVMTTGTKTNVNTKYGAVHFYNTKRPMSQVLPELTTREDLSSNIYYAMPKLALSDYSKYRNKNLQDIDEEAFEDIVEEMYDE